jgi:hypothetical protein
MTVLKQPDAALNYSFRLMNIVTKSGSCRTLYVLYMFYFLIHSVAILTVLINTVTMETAILQV